RRAPGSRQEAPRAPKHPRFALVRGGCDVALLSAHKQVLPIDKTPGNTPAPPPAVIDDRFGERSHQPDRATAIDQADAVLGQNSAELSRRVHESWVVAGAGGAVDANRCNCAHGQWMWPEGGRASSGRERATPLSGWGDCSLENLYMRGVRRSALAARQSGPVCRMDSYPRSTEALKREVSAAGGGSLFSIMRGLWPYIWPAERRDLKLRVAVAMLLLLAAKLVTIAVPFTFKWATDALTGEGSAPVAPSAWLVWALAAPIVMTIAYGGTRILMAVLTQMRDGIFAQVAMNAVRRLAYRTFEHMHQLSLR